MSGSVRGVGKHADRKAGRCALPLLYDRGVCKSLDNERRGSAGEALRRSPVRKRTPNSGESVRTPRSIGCPACRVRPGAFHEQARRLRYPIVRCQEPSLGSVSCCVEILGVAQSSLIRYNVCAHHACREDTASHGYCRTSDPI